MLKTITTAARRAYLRWRLKSARQECEQLVQVWDWIPEQLASHKRYIQRWERELQRLEAGQQAQTPSTLTPGSDFSPLR